MKYILILLISFNFIYAKAVDVDIQAEYFDSDETKNLVIFRGSVSMVKEGNTLVCDEIILKTKIDPKTNKKTIVSYEATGNVSFTIKNETTDLIGNGGKVTYDIEKRLYVVIGNGYLEDRFNDKIIRGENIYMNQNNGHIRVDGSKEKPVQFKFKMQSK